MEKGLLITQWCFLLVTLLFSIGLFQGFSRTVGQYKQRVFDLNFSRTLYLSFGVVLFSRSLTSFAGSGGEKQIETTSQPNYCSFRTDRYLPVM